MLPYVVGLLLRNSTMNTFTAGDELCCISDGGNVWLTVGKGYACKGVATFGSLDCVYVKCDCDDMAHYAAEYFVLADDANAEGIADRLQGLVIQAELARDSYRQERRAYLDVAGMLLELQGEAASVCRELDFLVNGPIVERAVE